MIRSSVPALPTSISAGRGTAQAHSLDLDEEPAVVVGLALADLGPDRLDRSQRRAGCPPSRGSR